MMINRIIELFVLTAFFIVLHTAVNADDRNHAELGEWHVKGGNAEDISSCLNVAKNLNARMSNFNDYSDIGAYLKKLEVPVSDTSVSVVTLKNDVAGTTYVATATGLPVYMVSDSLVVRLNEEAWYRPNQTLIARIGDAAGLNLKADYMICGNIKKDFEDMQGTDFAKCSAARAVEVGKVLADAPGGKRLDSEADTLWIESIKGSANSVRSLVAATSSVYFYGAPDSGVITDSNHPARIALLRLELDPSQSEEKQISVDPLSCVLEANMIPD